MNKFFFIRHGSTELTGIEIYGRTGEAPLSDLGSAQASRLADRLAAESIAAVYSSPQERSLETARPLADRLGQTIQIAAELDEVDFGAWTGSKFADLHDDERWRAFNTIRSCTRIPNGELILEVQNRAVRFIERLNNGHRDASVALVSHGDVIRAALSYYLGLPLDMMLRFHIDPGSVSILELGDEAPAIRCINNTELIYP
ncbi:MAG TPA: histidine phosphatase family protein [Candidatus Binatia bacterium]